MKNLLLIRLEVIVFLEENMNSAVTERVREESLKLNNLKEIPIGNTVYRITLLPASIGVSVGLQLIKTFLPVLGVLFDSGSINGEDTEALNELDLDNDTMFSEAAMLLVGQLDKFDVSELIGNLLRGTLSLIHI